MTQLARFSVGMPVELTAEDRRVLRGTIARLTRQTAPIVGPDGQWRVSPSLLRVIDQQQPPATTARIVQLPVKRHS